MKDINYTQLRSYKNLPKYDLGTRPSSSGYLQNDNQVLSGYYTQQATPITLSFVPQAISEGVGNLTSVMPLAISSYGAMLAGKSAAAAYGANLGSSATEAAAAGSSAAKNALGVTGKALGVLGAIHGTYGVISNALDSNALSSQDLLNASSKSTQYANGVAYDTYGGYDRAGVEKYMNRNKVGSAIKGATSGIEAGMGAGTLIGGPIGGLIGGGIGGVVGAVTGLFRGHKDKEKMKRAMRNWDTTATAYNQQSESSAASQGLRNQYYATHADAGLSPNFKNPNAMVLGGEPIVTINGKGEVVNADMFKITPETPERVDNIPVKLDLGDSKQGVIGNKIDPFTGQRLAVEGRPAVAALNDPTVKNKQPYKDTLKYLLDLLSVLPDNRDMKNNRIPKYNLGKCLPMFDAGWAYSAIPTAINFGNNLAGLIAAKKEPISVRDSYAPNYQASLAAALMPTTVDIYPELLAANDATRQGLYAIRLSGGLTGGQRMSMLNQLFNDRMSNMAKAYSGKTDRENTLRSNMANFLYTSGEAEAARRQNANQVYNENLRQALAAKQQLVDTRRKGMAADLNAGFENAFNWYMFNKNTDLYQQKINNEKAAMIAQAEKDALSRRSRRAGVYLPTSSYRNPQWITLKSPFQK